MNTTFLFEEQFESAVEQILKDLGFKTATSIYIDLGELKSQIDIIAYNMGRLYCIECKSMIAWKMNFSRNSNKWSYLGDDNLWHSIHSPYIQNKNHILLCKQYLNSLEGFSKWQEFYGTQDFDITNILIFKNTLNLDCLKDDIRKEIGIFRVDDLNQITKIYNQNDKPLSNLSQIAFELLSSLSDTSEEAKQKHKLYIYKCKTEKLGFFRPGRHCIGST